MVVLLSVRTDLLFIVVHPPTAAGKTFLPLVVGDETTVNLIGSGTLA
ncbi:MAG TPA: hypothetical protein VHO69_03230 [Phototrophicaceae bacterium]|nr:hypothetical protein [Phototrophicaceae bacterium]